MKKLIYISIIFMSLVLLNACDYLDEISATKIELDKTLSTEEEAVTFLYGGYALVKSVMFGTEFTSTLELVTDDSNFSSTDLTRKGLSFLTYGNNNKVVKSMWGKFYSLIEQMNILLDNLEKNPELTKDSGENMVAEARFIRAWAYFHLVQIWGDVPLVTIPVYDIKEDNITPSRAPASDVYAQIIADLVYAAEILQETPISVNVRPGNSSSDRKYPLALRRSAPKLLLAKTYLVLKQYSDVLETLAYFGNDVNNMNANYGLLTEFYSLYDPRQTNSTGRKKEVIWEIESKAESGLNNTLHRDMAPSELKGCRGENIIGLTSGYQNYIPTYDLISSFDQTNDVRYRKGYQFSKAAPSSRPQVMKFYDETAIDQTTAGVNMILLRTADVYLIYAEALNELGVPDQAKPFVDVIRARAGLQPLPTGMLYSEMTDAILLERRHEFAHECGNRLFDLRRTGRYADVMKEYIRKQGQQINGIDAAGQTIATTAQFIEPTTGTTTPSIDIPFVKSNKVWSDKLWLHPIPADEIIANPNLKVSNNWN